MDRFPLVGLLSLVLGLGAAPGASAQVPSETLDFAQPAFSAPEDAGVAVITVSRSDASTPATVRYGTTPMTALKDTHYEQVQGVLSFAVGEDSQTFTIPLRNDDVVQGDRTVKVALYGLQDAQFPGGDQSRTAVLTIVEDDVVSRVRDSANPLGLVPAPGDNPLEGASFYVNPDSLAARKARESPPAERALIAKIADQPETKRFGMFDGVRNIRKLTSAFFRNVEDTAPETVPVVATYVFPHKPPCDGTNAGGGAAGLATYKKWIDEFAAGIGNSRAVILHEIDATITAHCLSATGRRMRAEGMRYAVDKLTALPRTVVYIDAGAADGPYRPPAVASILKSFGIARAQGFFLNATHQDETSDEVAFGNAISKLTGGKRFVVNTATNGRGPVESENKVANGNTVRCNPLGAGLGTPPTWRTGYALADAFLWIGQPGRSAGACAGADRNPPQTGEWWQEYALHLARNAVFGVGGGGDGVGGDGPGTGAGNGAGGDPGTAPAAPGAPPSTGGALKVAALKVSPRGAIAFRLSGASKVVLAFERCVKAKGRGCKRWKAASRVLTTPGRAGPNAVPFRGRVRGKKLKKGLYRVRITALGAGGSRSPAATRNFRLR